MANKRRIFMSLPAVFPASRLLAPRTPAGPLLLAPGTFSEITGPPSSGKTTLFWSMLAAATARGEHCALVDSCDMFDPEAAGHAGVDLTRLLWARCNWDATHALQVADLLLQGGGFGLVCLDLADTPDRALQQIQVSAWYRLKRILENTPARFVLLTRRPMARSAAQQAIECRQRRIRWSGEGPGRLLDGIEMEAIPRKPQPLHSGIRIEAQAL